VTPSRGGGRKPAAGGFKGGNHSDCVYEGLGPCGEKRAGMGSIRRALPENPQPSPQFFWGLCSAGKRGASGRERISISQL